LSLFIGSGGAGINLTIQSLNNKSIIAIDQSNNSIIDTLNQSELTSLPYTNVMIKVKTGDTFNMGNLGTAVRKIPNDWIFFFVVFTLIACAIATAWLFKRK
jgi:hypothetical protein